MKKSIFFSVLIVSIVGLSFSSILEAQQTVPRDSGPACTMEAKLCPDGSSVGRVGPNCEFAPCPPGTRESRLGAGAPKSPSGVPRRSGVAGPAEDNADQSTSSIPLNVEQPAWTVPRGNQVMVDGKLDQGEWDDAPIREVRGLMRVLVKQSDEYVFLAVELEHREDGTLDLYLSPSADSVYDLHASAKLGERRLAGRSWPAWEWWNNAGWVANTARVESFQKPSFLPTKIREFQISRSRFQGHEWKVMFEVRTPAEPEWKVSSYPSGCKSNNTAGWILLKLE